MTAFSKVWLGTTSTDASVATNWQAIGIRNATYRWLASGSGTNEYYLDLVAGGDPGIPEAPGALLINGVAATGGTVGSLAAGQWAFDDNDTLGYDTIYVRLADGADPDSKVRDYISFQAIPFAGDPIRLAAAATNGIAGYDLSARATNTFVIDSGFKDLPVGSFGNPLRIAPTAFLCEGSGSRAFYIDLGSAAILPEVRNTPKALTGARGLYLTGSALTGLICTGGATGLATHQGETSSATAVSIANTGDVWLSSGVTCTSVSQKGGTSRVKCNATTVTMEGGLMTSDDAAAFTTLNVRGGQMIDNSSGNHGTVNLDDGTLDTLQDNAAKTYTTFKHNGGTFKENVGRVTITTRSAPDFSGVVSRARA